MGGPRIITTPGEEAAFRAVVAWAADAGWSCRRVCEAVILSNTGFTRLCQRLCLEAERAQLVSNGRETQWKPVAERGGVEPPPEISAAIEVLCEGRGRKATASPGTAHEKRRARWDGHVSRVTGRCQYMSVEDGRIVTCGAKASGSYCQAHAARTAPLPHAHLGAGFFSRMDSGR